MPDAVANSSVDKSKKKHGCIRGCFLFLLILILLVGGFVASAMRLPEKFGITKSKAEKVFDVQNPDRAAAEDLRVAFEKEGIATKGMDVYVLPEKDGEGASAYVVLDQSQGFTFSSSKDGDPFLNTLATLAKSEAAKKNGITRVAFEYKDAQGRALISMGAKVQDGADFANGKITREQFMAKVGGKTDIKNVIDAQLEMLGVVQ